VNGDGAAGFLGFSFPAVPEPSPQKEKTDMSRFNETHRQILFAAWALHARDKAFVPAPDLFPECDRLVEAGWLERRIVDANGDIAFRWTRQAELALDINALTAPVEGQQN
jgi:hypothetical protein